MLTTRIFSQPTIPTDISTMLSRRIQSSANCVGHPTRTESRDIIHISVSSVSIFFGYLQYLSLTYSLQLSSPLKRPLPAHETERGHAVSPQLGHAGDGRNPFQDKPHRPESSGNRLTFHKYICTTSTVTLDPSWVVHIIVPIFFFFLMSVTFEIDHTFLQISFSIWLTAKFPLAHPLLLHTNVGDWSYITFVFWNFRDHFRTDGPTTYRYCVLHIRYRFLLSVVSFNFSTKRIKDRCLQKLVEGVRISILWRDDVTQSTPRTQLMFTLGHVRVQLPLYQHKPKNAFRKPDRGFR